MKRQQTLHRAVVKLTNCLSLIFHGDLALGQSDKAVLILLRKSVQKTEFDLSPVCSTKHLLVMKKSYQCSLSTSNNTIPVLIILSNSFRLSSFVFRFKSLLSSDYSILYVNVRHYCTTPRSTKIGLFALHMTMPSLPPCANARNSSMHGAALLHCY